MSSKTFSTSVSIENEIYLEYLEELAERYGGVSGANMECIRFHKEQHVEPLGVKIDKLTKRIKELESKLSQ